jgi:hypothetical protein
MSARKMTTHAPLPKPKQKAYLTMFPKAGPSYAHKKKKDNHVPITIWETLTAAMKHKDVEKDDKENKVYRPITNHGCRNW